MSPFSISIEQFATPKTCIVAGSGRSLMVLGGPPVPGRTELADALALAPRAHLMAVNFTGLYIAAPLHHIAGLHSQEVGDYRKARIQRDYCNHFNGPIQTETHSGRAHEGVDHVWPQFNGGGTSSLFAVRVALALGYERVILAGVPFDNSGRFYDPPNIPDVCVWPWDKKEHRRHWEKAAAEEFQGRVTSLGGWTAELLGRTKE